MHSINTDTRQVETVPGMGGRGDILPVILKLKQNKLGPIWLGSLAWINWLKKNLKGPLDPQRIK